MPAGPERHRVRRAFGLTLPRLGEEALRESLKALEVFAGVVPAPLARGVAESLTVAASYTPQWPGGAGAWAARRRLLAGHLLKVVGRDVPPQRLRAMVDDAIASYARYWAESLRLSSVTPEELEAGIVYEGLDRLEASMALGRGTILAVPHLGGWEWGGADVARRGWPVSVVVERLVSDGFFEWFVELRSGLGMSVIPTGPGAASACTAALGRNEVLCLLSDRAVGTTATVDVEFFGETTGLPAGPAALALRTGATLLPAAVYFEKRTSKHLGVVAEPVEATRSGRLRDDVARVTQSLAAALERLVRRAPTQWHLMSPNWPSDQVLQAGARARLR